MATALPNLAKELPRYAIVKPSAPSPSLNREGLFSMDILLWVLQIVTALLYAASGVMKLFFFDKVSKDVPSFGALPRPVWAALGILELLGTIALILPGVLKSHTGLTAIAAVVLCVESLLFIWVHIKYTEKTPIVMSVVLGVVMAFIAYGRFALTPL